MTQNTESITCSLKPMITENGLNYVLVGDYYFPLLTLPEEKRSIGYWGRKHLEYIRKNRPILFNQLALSGKLKTYLADLNEQVHDRLELIMQQMKQAEGITEALKTSDQMAWVRAMNSIRSRAEGIILHEMIYGEDEV